MDKYEKTCFKAAIAIALAVLAAAIAALLLADLDSDQTIGAFSAAGLCLCVFPMTRRHKKGGRR